MKKKIIASIIIVLCAVLIFTGFYFVLKSGRNSEADVTVSETQYLIQTDLSRNYPSSPRAVTNLYCRMLACMYNEEQTEDELDALLEQMYLLYDASLQEANPVSQFKLGMQSDLLSHATDGYKISDYIMPDTDEVTKKTIDGQDMALLTVAFFVKDESGFQKTYQDFVLRESKEDGKWYIYGYSLHS